MIKFIFINFNFYNNGNNIFIRQYNISRELYNLKYYISLRGVIFNILLASVFLHKTIL